MAKKIVVGSDQMPNPEQLLEMYEKLDSQTKEIRSQFRRGVLAPRHVQALIEHRNPFEKKPAEKKLADGIARLFVDYTRPFADMIRDGKYGWVNSDITEKHFPINQRQNGEVEMKVFHFNRVMGSDEAIREIDKEGYRPAELPEGLAYAKANPDEQRKYPIAILGSVWHYWRGHRHVPCLDRWHDGRGLVLGWFGDDWDVCCRFLAVRK